MKSSSQSPRTPSRLSDSVHHQLNMYALAASAAGVGVLALAQPSMGEIIYTHAHVKISIAGNGRYGRYLHFLDLDHHDGHDFSLRMSRFESSSRTGRDTWMTMRGDAGNRVAGHPPHPGSGGLAYALRAGRQIGPDLRFGPYSGEFMAARAGTPGGHTTACNGPWHEVTERYLGLRFGINGQVHYGWARLNVHCKPKLHGLLTGYAYETIPNKPIIAGKTKGPDVMTFQPGSLGALAAGAPRPHSGK